MPARKVPPRAFAAVIAANICLAFGPWMVRMADVGPIASGFWRMTLAIPLLFAATRIARQPVPRLAPSTWLALGLAGACFAIDLAAWHSGIVRTRLANASLFGNVTSFFFAAYGFIVARRWPGPRQAGALLLAVCGTLLLVGRSYELSPNLLVGDMLCILAGLAYMGYLVVLDRARARLQSWPLLLIATLFGVATMAPLVLLSGEPFLPHDWTPLILLAIGSQVVGQGLTVYALGQVPPIVIGLGLLLQPVIGATIGWIGYGERLTAADLIGAAAIATALVLVRERR